MTVKANFWNLSSWRNPSSSNEVKQSSFLRNFPHEIWLNILSFLNTQGIQTFRSLCKECHCFTQDKEVWANLFHRAWPGANSNGIKDLETFREANHHGLLFIKGLTNFLKCIFKARIDPPYVMNLAVLPSSTQIHGNSTIAGSMFERWSGEDCDFIAQMQTEDLDAKSSMVISSTYEHLNTSLCPHYMDEGRGLFFEGDDLGNVYVWKIDNGTYKTLKSAYCDRGPIGKAISFAIHHNHLFTGHSLGLIQLWDLNSDTCIAALKAPNDKAKLPIQSLAIVENELVASRSDGQNMVFDLNTCEFKKSFNTSSLLRFDQGFSYCISSDGIIEIVDPRRGKYKITCVKKNDKDEGHHKPISVVHFILGCLCTGSEDGTIKIWDLETKKCLRTIEAFGNGKITTLRFANRKLFAGTNRGEITIFGFSDTVKPQAINNNPPEQNPANSWGFWDWLRFAL